MNILNNKKNLFKLSRISVLLLIIIFLSPALMMGNILLNNATMEQESVNPISSSTQLPINLGTSGNFAILSNTGVTTTGSTTIIGDIGVSPIGATAITGFGLVLDASGEFSRSTLVSGKIYAAGYATPTPAMLTTAVGDMDAAYTDAAGRTSPDVTELGAGILSGITITPGLYKWSSPVSITTDITLSGNAAAVWIFQIAQTLTVSSNVRIILSGGAQARNIFWQVAGVVALGTYSNFKGNILGGSGITLNTGAKLNGRALAQTAVTLISNTITIPADIINPLVSSTFPTSNGKNVPINSKVSAIFSEPMDPLTINSTTFILMNGSTSTSGTVTYIGVTALFVPTIDLQPNTIYNATITTEAKDLAGNSLQVNKTWIFTTGNAPDIIAPTVSLLTPINGAIRVPINSKISVTFSEPMDPLTITNTTILLNKGAISIPGTVIYAVVTAVFTPTSLLNFSTKYTVNVTTDVKDLAGNSKVISKVWYFTTDAIPDTVAPTVISTTPTKDAKGIAINSAIAATFSEAIDPLTINAFTFTLKQNVTTVEGSVTYSGLTAVFTPTNNLTSEMTYTAVLTTLIQDLAGNDLADNRIWNFTTNSAHDKTAPSVSYTIPINAGTSVKADSQIIAAFSEWMDPLTITILTIKLMQGITPISGAVIYAGVIATFIPEINLEYNTEYTVNITSDLKDLAGNNLIENYIWTFSTAKAPLAPVDLGIANNFVILSKSGVTTTGSTTIIGDIGVSPIAATAITGFGLVLDASGEFSTSAIVTGKIYAADYATPTPSMLTTAVSNMEAAYTDAAGRTLPDFTELGAGILSGMTLIPGLYKWSSTVSITTNITLEGDEDDVWIFQIAQTLTVSSNIHVILSGGAQARNIFWQVAGVVTLGTYSDFSGNILAKTAIVLNTGAELNGRALAQTAVTLDANAVIVPPDYIHILLKTTTESIEVPVIEPWILILGIVSIGLLGASIILFIKRKSLLNK